ncbi:MAG: hypothetical protein PsegKO_35700 [Pseudohongiellaceae bacterium]
MNLRRCKPLRVLTALLMVGSLTGCLAGSVNQPQITLEKDLAVGFGSGLFDLVTQDSSEAVNQPDAGQVRVLMYKVTAANDQNQFPDTVFERTLRKQGSGLAWERIVRVREDDSQVWVFAGMNIASQRLETLCVFVMQDGDRNPQVDAADLALWPGSIQLSRTPAFTVDDL